ncbi:hypothetical protein D3C77_420640 [compost metagenome]
MFLAVMPCNRIGVATAKDQGAAVVRLTLLLTDVQALQRATDPMGHGNPGQGIGQAGPDHVARQAIGFSCKTECEGTRQGPENADERNQRNQRTDERQQQLERVLDHQPHIIGDALVGVVRLAVL